MKISKFYWSRKSVKQTIASYIDSCLPLNTLFHSDTEFYDPDSWGYNLQLGYEQILWTIKYQTHVFLCISNMWCFCFKCWRNHKDDGMEEVSNSTETSQFYHSCHLRFKLKKEISVQGGYQQMDDP